MSDHNEQDPAARDQRPERAPEGPAEQPDSATPASRTRHRQLTITAAIVLPAIVVLLIASGGGGQRPPRSSTQTAAAGATTVVQRIDALLAGIPQSGDALGSPTAPVTLQFFGDLECPTSRAFTLEALPALIGKWVRGGELRIEYRSLETSTREPVVFIDQQTAALAAGMQDRLWYYVELFYNEQGHEDSGYVNEGYLDNLAEQTLGLNLAHWSKDHQEPPLAAEVATDEQAAARLGFHETPSFLIGRTGGEHAERLQQFSVSEPAAFDASIERVLAERPPSRSSLTSYQEAAGRLALVDWASSPQTSSKKSLSC